MVSPDNVRIPEITLGDLWKISGVLHTEIVFKSISKMMVTSDTERIAKRLKMSVNTNKFLLTLILVIAASSGAYYHTVISYSAALGMLFFVIVFLSLNFVISFLSVKSELLLTLPLSKHDVSKINILTFLRIFDYPLMASSIIFAVVAYFHTPLSVPISIAVFTATSVLALATSIRLAKFFYEKIDISTESKWATLLRTIYMTAWATSFYGAYLVISLSYRIFNANMTLTFPFTLIFPFSFGYLLLNPTDVFAYLSSAPYFALALLSFRWLTTEIARVTPSYIKFESGRVRPLKIRRQISALVAKDLKLITRNPAFFGIFGFPIVYALLYAYQMPKSLAVILGVFVMIQTFCGLAAFISLSVDRSLYTSILPVTQLKVAVSKVIISICVYIFSSTILAISMFLRAMPFYLPVLLLPSAISVVLFVLILAPQHSSGNLYSGLHFLFLILIPSAIISTIPVLTGYFGMLLGFRFEAPTLISALMEMFAMIAVFNIRFRS